MIFSTEADGEGADESHLVGQALEELDAELERHADGRGTVSSEAQLLEFRARLELMREHLESHELPPTSQRSAGMGRVIADSWPFDNELGSLIVKAERAYINAG